MKRVLILVCIFSCFALLVLSADADSPTHAIVSRNANLRREPSTVSPKIITLHKTDEVELIDSESTDGFYHVRTQEGQEGWISSRLVSIRPGNPDELASLTASSSVTPVIANQISDMWEKPAPKKTILKGTEGACPWNGDDTDPDTFSRKNRSDLPDNGEYHDVKWTAIHDLPFPKDKPLRANWSPENLAVIAKFEGAAIRTIGYLVAIKPQSGGSGEGTNCHFTQAADTDTHLALVGEAGGAEKDSVVIEFTPRFLKAHPNWNRKNLLHWVDTDTPVRISGWLMIDPDHRNHLNRFRFTLWEIHPITKIEVFEDNTWKSVDDIQ